MSRPTPAGPPTATSSEPFWSEPIPDLLARLDTGANGLSAQEAGRRLLRVGPNSLAPPARGGAVLLLLRQFTSPIILILTEAALLSFLLDSPTDGLIILAIVLISGLLGFWQENGAAGAMAQLLKTVQTTARVRRDAVEQSVPVAEVVAGDLLVLSAGAGIPADCRLREERDLSLNEAALTGESFPVSKHPLAVAAEAPLAGRTIVLFFGTHVVSGSGSATLPCRCGPRRLIHALRRAGHVVGHLGDGINDAPALHAADVGLSVQGEVDVAKEAADIVLLEPDLAVLLAGILEGRRTFTNTLKYVFMATSANFGNMFSMAGASLLLPFLPLLPKQILLTNLLTDLPEMTIASDRVDPDWIKRPHRWSLPFIRRFMVTFGLVRSVFDYLTFAVLLWVLKADAAQFRTGWFVESVISAASILLVIRTRGPLFRSRPSRRLVGATLAVVVITLVLPWTALGHLFGLVPLPPAFLALMAVILAAFVASAEVAKGWFYRHLAR